MKKMLVTEELLCKYKELFIKYSDIIYEYFENNAKKLRETVDVVLWNLHFYDVDKEDFYSLANEIFIIEVLVNFDDTQDFKKFLYSCLYKKFCTEMNGRNRKKRRNVISVEKRDELGNIIKDKDEKPIIEDIHIPDKSIYEYIGDDENSTVGDMIASKTTIETTFFGEKKDGYSPEMQEYLSRLSILQQEVLRLISIGFMPSEIIEELHINQKLYEDCYSAIHSYRNISVFF